MRSTSRTDTPSDPAARHSGRVLTRNSLLNLAGLTATLLVGIFAMPPMVDGLGPDRFGVLGLVWTVFAYLTLLDLGLGRATTKFAAEAISFGDDEELAALTHTAAIVQLAIGVLVAAAGVALATPLVDWLNVPAALRSEATGAFVVIALIAPAMGLANTFRGLLEAGQRFGVINLISAPSSAANYLVPLLGVSLGWSLTAIVAGMAAVRAITFAAYGLACLRAWPSLARRAAFDRVRLRRMMSFGAWISVSSVVSPLLVYIDRFAIGALLTVAAVGYYTAPHEVVTRLSILPTAIVATLFPAFAAFAVAADRAARSEVLFVRATKYVLALVAPPLLVLAALSHGLLSVWLGADFAERAAPALTILALGMIVNAVAYVPSTLIQASGRADVTAKLHLIELPLHVFLLWLFIAEWGITGAALAWTLRVTLDAVLLFVVTARMELVAAALLAGERLPLTVASLALYGAALAGVALRIDHIAAQATAACVILAVWSAFAWKRALGSVEQAELLGALRLDRAGAQHDPAG